MSNETHAAPPALSGRDARAANWSGGRIATLVIGVVLALVSLVLVGAGGVAVWADQTQRESGYATTDVHEFSTAGSALTTERTHLGSAGVGWLYAPGLLGKVRIRVTPAGGSAPLFVGIGRSAEVDRYLAGVNHSLISDFFKEKVEQVGGGLPRALPGTQRFWVASSSGPGARTVVWKPQNGSWTVVVMNADARPGVAVRADMGARFPALLWIGVGVFAGGLLLLAGGGFLVAGAIRRGRIDQVRA